MWRFKVGEGGNDPYIYSMNNFGGRQIWKFDPNIQNIEERAEVEHLREILIKNRLNGFPSADLLWRLQLFREKNFKQSIPQVKVEDGEEISYEVASDAMKRGAYFVAAIQASDGHWPSQLSGPQFYLCPMLICMHIMGTMDKILSPELRKKCCATFTTIRMMMVMGVIRRWSQYHVLHYLFNYISLHLRGEEAYVEELSRSRNWIRHHDGVTSIPSWGKTWLSPPAAPPVSSSSLLLRSSFSVIVLHQPSASRLTKPSRATPPLLLQHRRPSVPVSVCVVAVRPTLHVRPP